MSSILKKQLPPILPNDISHIICEYTGYFILELRKDVKGMKHLETSVRKLLSKSDKKKLTQISSIANLIMYRNGQIHAKINYCFLICKKCKGTLCVCKKTKEIPPPCFNSSFNINGNCSCYQIHMN